MTNIIINIINLFHYEFDYYFDFGCQTFRNLLLLANFYDTFSFVTLYGTMNHSLSSLTVNQCFQFQHCAITTVLLYIPQLTYLLDLPWKYC